MHKVNSFVTQKGGQVLELIFAKQLNPEPYDKFRSIDRHQVLTH